METIPRSLGEAAAYPAKRKAGAMEKEGNGAEAPALAAADMQHSHKPRQTSTEGPSQIVFILQMCSVMPDVIIDGVKRIADASEIPN